MTVPLLYNNFNKLRILNLFEIHLMSIPGLLNNIFLGNKLVDIQGCYIQRKDFLL